MDQKCLHNNTYTENKKVYQSVANFVVDHEYEYIRDLFSPAKYEYIRNFIVDQIGIFEYF